MFADDFFAFQAHDVLLLVVNVVLFLAWMSAARKVKVIVGLGVIMGFLTFLSATILSMSEELELSREAYHFWSFMFGLGLFFVPLFIHILWKLNRVMKAEEAKKKIRSRQ